jgi:hypothetical protein
MGPVYDLVQEVAVEGGRFGSVSINMGWLVAEANTEDEWRRETADWEDGVIALEGEKFVLDIRVVHFSGCMAVVNQPMAGFRSQGRDIVDFETIVRSRYGVEAEVVPRVVGRPGLL